MGDLFPDKSFLAIPTAWNIVTGYMSTFNFVKNLKKKVNGGNNMKNLNWVYTGVSAQGWI